MKKSEQIAALKLECDRLAKEPLQGHSGIGHTGSRTEREVSKKSARRVSSLENSAGRSGPSAIRAAPGRATSMYLPHLSLGRRSRMSSRRQRRMRLRTTARVDTRRDTVVPRRARSPPGSSGARDNPLRGR